MVKEGLNQNGQSSSGLGQGDPGIPAMTYDLLLTQATVATMRPDGPPYGLIRDASIGITDGLISYVGPNDPAMSAAIERDVGGRLITPALIDCHTHLIFGGTRIGEFEDRLAGKSYADLAAEGGGIVSTVEATRAATDDDLFAGAAERMGWMLRSGVGTIEIKSGYGLNQTRRAPHAANGATTWNGGTPTGCHIFAGRSCGATGAPRRPGSLRR